MHSSVAIQILPDWTPSLVDRNLARFDTILKIPAGSLIEDGTLQLRLLDESLRLIEVKTTALTLGAEGPVVGPSWKVIRGELTKLPEASMHCFAVLNDARSTIVDRADATIPVLLRGIEGEVGLKGEPHLWWRFYNDTAQPISVERILTTTLLRIDDQTFLPRPSSYDGPAYLPPRRALSGVWSLDEFDSRAREGQHQFQLSILDQTSEAMTFEWTTL
jgi:hypothetical protein